MAVQRTLIGNIKGPKGDKGDTGDTGSRGAGATVTIGSITTTAYGGNASVTNSGTETDAVLDFVLPQGAPGETVTDMEDLTLSSMTIPSVQFPTPSIGDNGKTLFGKISKWFSDMAAMVATKLNAANVVNNLTTTASGYALDARQGKALNDRLTPSYASIKKNVSGMSGNIMQTKSGNVVIIKGDIATTAQIAVNTNIAQAIEYPFYTNNAVLYSGEAIEYVSGDVYPLLINQDNKNIYVTRAIPSGKYLTIHLMYICS